MDTVMDHTMLNGVTTGTLPAPKAKPEPEHAFLCLLVGPSTIISRRCYNAGGALGQLIGIASVALTVGLGYRAVQLPEINFITSPLQ